MSKAPSKTVKRPEPEPEPFDEQGVTERYRSARLKAIEAFGAANVDNDPALVGLIPSVNPDNADAPESEIDAYVSDLKLAADMIKVLGMEVTAETVSGVYDRVLDAEIGTADVEHLEAAVRIANAVFTPSVGKRHEVVFLVFDNEFGSPYDDDDDDDDGDGVYDGDDE